MSTPSCSRSSSSAQAVALALDAAERAAQLSAHPLEVVRERAELVAEAIVERRLEVAERERLRRDREAAQAECDQLCEHEADEDADQAGDHAGAQRLVVHGPDRRRDVGARAEHDEAPSPARRSGTPATKTLPSDVPAL